MTPPALRHLDACPACDARHRTPYCRVPSLFDAGEWITYERCATCAVVFRNPRPAEAARLDAYREREFGQAAKALQPRSQAHYRAVARRLRAHLPPAAGRRLFDFGCGAGGFLVEARAAGFVASGLELNRDLARHVGATYGIPVHCGEIGDLPATTEPFDVVTSFQVFEHLLDPRQVLAQLTARLAPRGLVFVEVPNLDDVRERLQRGRTMDDSHLFYFNPRSMRRLLATAGLTVVEVHEGLRPQWLLGDAAARLPTGVYRALERATAFAQLKTVLGVIATRR